MISLFYAGKKVFTFGNIISILFIFVALLVFASMLSGFIILYEAFMDPFPTYISHLFIYYIIYGVAASFLYQYHLHISSDNEYSAKKDKEDLSNFNSLTQEINYEINSIEKNDYYLKIAIENNYYELKKTLIKNEERLLKEKGYENIHEYKLEKMKDNSEIVISSL